MIENTLKQSNNAMPTAPALPKTREHRRFSRRILSGLFGLAAVTAALVGLGIYDSASFRNSGQQVDIGGRELFLRCRGTGTPTVILEHGLGSDAATWQTVQESLAKQTRVCVTSRAGMGFSDPFAGHETRTAQDAADDLANVLDIADIPGPYVLVGHSFGGYVIRLFADQHPDNVVAMVLVDSSHEQQTQRQANRLEQLLSPEAWAELGTPAVAANPERMDIAASSAQVAAIRPLGNLPLRVLEAAGKDRGNLDETQQSMAELWSQLQGELAGLSTNSTHKVVAGSGHFIHIDQPEVVIEAVLSVIFQ